MSADLRWLPATTLDELWEGDLAEVEVGGDAVLLAHLPGGELRAYQALCPHSEFPLVAGDLDGRVLTCAAHGWEFDLVTGRGLNPGTCRLYAFPVRLEGERIDVAVPADGLRHHNRCRG
ncbi:toluene monooxygenase system ferredoxin subunit [Nonomuraea thailandensis]|uniref:Toluene monooxygenase system ferredoxin subunit n=1 Tax=Nonomuraea thailandensis TaxID=1188745 RepID=A0A9X2GI45_9ACTN|nr:Rieske 2Fe-2S domain-containing protein [Nonomuraea thailandensis]MCP2358100.1 toluene monooxygenase system ferredoxin subunit [Nonomuraea thailandensis]